MCLLSVYIVRFHRGRSLGYRLTLIASLLLERHWISTYVLRPNCSSIPEPRIFVVLS